jgi:hypothetical protein
MQNHYLDIWLLIQNRKVMIESFHFHRTPGAVVLLILVIYLKNKYNYTILNLL